MISLAPNNFYLAVYLAVALVLCLTASQGFFAVLYTRLLLAAAGRRREYNSSSPSTSLPRAAVVLSLRGSDPFLLKSMSALLDQDYDDFTLFIVVDSPNDSAWPDVRRLEAMAPERVKSQVLQNRLETCSLKCCALAEVTEQLDASYEVVAYLDGDAAPHRRWLRDLVEPLSDRSIGVTTGNRWYTPGQVTWGSMVRYFWNAGAVVQVWLNGILWAGSMAMRRETIEKISLVEAWRTSLSVDGAGVRQIRKAKLKTLFVPNVIMPNREDITIAQFIPWSERQLVAAKSSESGWGLVLLHACTIAFCVFAPVVMIAVGATGDQVLYRAGWTALLCYWIGAASSSAMIEYAMQQVLRGNKVRSKWMSLRALLFYVPSLVLCHIVYFRTLVGAHYRTRVSWRGVEYQLSGINDVRMINYRPYQSAIEGQDVQSVV